MILNVMTKKTQKQGYVIGYEDKDYFIEDTDVISGSVYTGKEFNWDSWEVLEDGEEKDFIFNITLEEI